MLAWELLVDAFRTILVVVTHALGGSLGNAIIAVAVAVRLLLLPWTVRVAVRARALQRRLKALEPDLARLRQRHAHDPRRLATEMQALYRRHGVQFVPRGTLALAAVQLPLGGALYQALLQGLGAGRRYLWLADLARPDAALAAMAALLAGAAAVAGTPSASTGATWSAYGAAAISALLTLVLVWRLAAGVGLYWAASSLVGIVQGVLVRRADARTVAAV